KHDQREQDGQHGRIADHNHAARCSRSRTAHRQPAAAAALQSEPKYADIRAAAASAAATSATKPPACTAERSSAAQYVAARKRGAHAYTAVVPALHGARILAILCTGRAGVAQW